MSRTPCTSCETWGEEDSNDKEEREQRSPHCPSPQWKSKRSCPLHLGIGVATEYTTQPNTRWDNTIPTQRREHYQFQVGPHPVQQMKDDWPTHTPLVSQRKDPNLSPVESEIPKAGACLRPLMYMFAEPAMERYFHRWQ